MMARSAGFCSFEPNGVDDLLRNLYVIIVQLVAAIKYVVLYYIMIISIY